MDVGGFRGPIAVFAVAVLLTTVAVFYIGEMHASEYREPFYDSLEDVFQLDDDGYDGSQAFKVSSVQGWNYFASLVNSGYTFAGKDVYLTCDLDFANTLAYSVGGISGRMGSPFAGNFHGEGHTVSNVTVIASMFQSVDGSVVTSTSKGLFGAVVGNGAAHASVSDLNVSGVRVSGCGLIAVIAGVCSFADIVNCTTDSACGAVLRSTPSSFVSGFQAVGGLIGVGMAASVSGCANHADVTLDVTYSEGTSGVGGIAGLLGDTSGVVLVPSILRDTANYGSISIASTYGPNGFNVGGIVGAACDTVLEDLVNYGDITADIGSIGDEGSGSNYWQGGIAGGVFTNVSTDYSTPSARNLVNTGDMVVEVRFVLNVDFGVGGIFGKNGGNLGPNFTVYDEGGVRELRTLVNRGLVATGLVQDGDITVTIGNSSTFRDSENMSWIGGISGYLSSSLSDSTSSGSLVFVGSDVSQPVSIGGIVGGLDGTGDCGISGCTNRMSVYAEVDDAVFDDASDIAHVLRVAGLAGHTGSSYPVEGDEAVSSLLVPGLTDICSESDLSRVLPFIRGCANHGDIRVLSSNIYALEVSGIAGYSEAVVSGCMNYGDVDVTARGRCREVNTSSMVADMVWGMVSGCISTGDLRTFVIGESFSASMHTGTMVGICRNAGYASFSSNLNSGHVVFGSEGVVAGLWSARIAGDGLCVGGMIGSLQGMREDIPVSVRDSANTGNIDVGIPMLRAGDSAHIGAFAGRISGVSELVCCCAVSAVGVVVVEPESEGYVEMGGFAGTLAPGVECALRSCFVDLRDVSVSGDVAVDPMAASCSGFGAVLEDCLVLYDDVFYFWDGPSLANASGLPEPAQVVGAETADLSWLLSLLNGALRIGGDYRWIGNYLGFDYDVPFLVHGEYVRHTITYDAEVPEGSLSYYDCAFGMTFSLELPILVSDDSSVRFAGWTAGSGEPFLCIMSDMGDVVLSPVWIHVDMFTITFTAENGSVSVPERIGDEVSIRGNRLFIDGAYVEAVADEGCQFSHWEADGNRVFGSVKLSADTVMKAVFVKSVHVYLSVDDEVHAHIVASVIDLAPGTVIYLVDNELRYDNRSVRVYLDEGYAIRTVRNMATGLDEDLVGGFTVEADTFLMLTTFDLNHVFTINVVVDGEDYLEVPYTYSDDGAIELDVELDSSGGRHVESVLFNGLALKSQMLRSNTPGRLILEIPRSSAVDADVLIFTAVGDGEKIMSDALGYGIDSEGTLVIFGTGPMRDYSLTERPPWHGESFNRVHITSGVWNVGDYAFFGEYELEYVDLGDTVVTIGDRAFYGCLLKSVSMPTTLSYIHPGAFTTSFNINGSPIADMSTVALIRGVFHSGTAGMLESGTINPVEVGRINVVPSTYSSEGHYDSVIVCSVCGMKLTPQRVVTEKLVSDVVDNEGNHYYVVSGGTTVTVSSLDLEVIKDAAESSPGTTFDIRTPSATMSLGSRSLRDIAVRDLIVTLSPESVPADAPEGTLALFHSDLGGEFIELDVSSIFQFAYTGPETGVKVVDVRTGVEYPCSFANGYVSFAPDSFSEFAVMEVSENYYESVALISAVIIAIVIAALSAGYIAYYERRRA